VRKKQFRPRLPPKLRVLVKSELDSHIKAHLGAHHFAHIRNVHSASARAKSKSNAKQTPILEADLPVYGSDCGLLARAGIHEVHLLGRILLMCPRPRLFAQVEVQESNEHYTVARVSTGSSVIRLKKAVDRALLNQRPGESSELRVLRVSALHLSALWTHQRRNSRDDCFEATTSNFAGMLPGRIYKRTKAEALLKKRATDMIVAWYERAQKENKSDFQPSAFR
jgi:hypothetical protein